MVKIRILATGGSMDKTYCGKASDFIVSTPTLPTIFSEAFADLNHELTVQEICRLDSLALTDENREAVRQAVETCEEDFIIVTHGTDTMWRTAHHVEETAKRLNKTVVYCGAMMPTSFANTDAKFNVGFATAILLTKGPGCHVVMGGLVFSRPLRIYKDLDRCVYYEGDEDRTIE